MFGNGQFCIPCAGAKPPHGVYAHICGIDLVRTLKQDSGLKAIPVVIVSYKDRGEDRLRGLDAGANYYLTKSSFHDEKLVEAVEDLIGAAA